MKSFELKFDIHGNVVVGNIKGVEGQECLELTRPYIEELEDKNNPAITVMDEVEESEMNKDFAD